MLPQFPPKLESFAKPYPTKNGERGFSLVEVIAAMVILLIALLGVFAVFTFCVNYNAGNSARAQALSVLQKETELLKSAKFTPFITDSILSGGVKSPKTIVSADGKKYSVETVIDDDPFTAGVQSDFSGTLKEITITVRLESPTAGWQTAVPVKTILRRVRAN
jgi:prepilin-type N-terminal cleavage/methylation domain-containing protein